MHPLLAYLKSIPRDEREKFATDCKTTLNYMRKACSAGQTFGAELCVAIEKRSAGAVPRQVMRSADWHLIWPELAEKIGDPTAVEPHDKAFTELRS